MADSQSTPGNATLEINGKSVSYPIIKGSTGPDVVDIRKLFGDTGAFTYDPGYKSPASCESKSSALPAPAGAVGGDDGSGCSAVACDMTCESVRSTPHARGARRATRLARARRAVHRPYRTGWGPS